MQLQAEQLLGTEACPWNVSSTLHTNLALNALNQALSERQTDDRLIHHSDRGAQYLSIRYSERLEEYGVSPSVGTVGDSYDNALAETLNGLYKSEMINHQGPWKPHSSGRCFFDHSGRLPEHSGDIVIVEQNQAKPG